MLFCLSDYSLKKYRNVVTQLFTIAYCYSTMSSTKHGITKKGAGSMSIAEFYGWTYHNHPVAGKVQSQCNSCGEEMHSQRESVMYECERCMNDQQE